MVFNYKKSLFVAAALAVMGSTSVSSNEVEVDLPAPSFEVDTEPIPGAESIHSQSRNTQAGTDVFSRELADEKPTCGLREGSYCRKFDGFCATNKKKCIGVEYPEQQNEGGVWYFMESGCDWSPPMEEPRSCGCCLPKKPYKKLIRAAKRTKMNQSVMFFAELPEEKGRREPSCSAGEDADLVQDNMPGSRLSMAMEGSDDSFRLMGANFIYNFPGAAIIDEEYVEKFQLGGMPEQVSFTADMKALLDMSDDSLSCKLGDRCKLTVPGFLHSSLIDEIHAPKPDPDGRSDHIYEAKRLPADMTLVVSFKDFTDEPDEKTRGAVHEISISSTSQLDGVKDLRRNPWMVVANKIEMLQQSALSPAEAKPELSLVAPKFKWWYEFRRRICVQPVRVRQWKCTKKFLWWCIQWSPVSISGQGLFFGMPGANYQWAKADVSFYWKNWVTINDFTGKYKHVTTGEMASLRSKWNDPKCIEVFFVENFSPDSTYGGGACWSCGTANAKIISSDGMVPCGVDKTHLAHELGHAMGLGHPFGSGSLPAGTTNTLMCPSGWERDNPRRNSWMNKWLLSNPLFTWYLSFWSPWPFMDCVNNADCGSQCILPPDSC